MGANCKTRPQWPRNRGIQFLLLSTIMAHKLLFGMSTQVGPRKHVRRGCILAPPGEYGDAAFLSNYFDHLFGYGSVWIKAKPSGRRAFSPHQLASHRIVLLRELIFHG